MLPHSEGMDSGRWFDYSHKNQDMVNPEGEPREKLKDTSVCLYFHVHPSIVCRKKKSGVLIEIPGAKKMPFYRKIMGLIGFGKVTGIFRLFRLRFPTYIFADLPDDFCLCLFKFYKGQLKLMES